MEKFLSFQKNLVNQKSPLRDLSSEIKEPYRTSRYQLGEQMYDLWYSQREIRMED